MDITYLNKQFRFVYSPKNILNFIVKENPVGFILSNRFLIGAGQLTKYIGKKNTETVIKTALNSKTDKVTCKFRKYGKIEVYVK